MSLYANKPLPEAVRVRIIAVAKSESELSLAAMSERLGMSWRTISRVLEAAGVRAPKPRRRRRTAS